MKKFLLFPIFLFLFSNIFSQDKFTLSGYVKDGSNGEDIYAANVYDKESLKGVSTNFYGFYSLSLPAGTYTIRYTSLGYKILEKVVLLNKDIKLDVDLISAAQDIKEVVVTGKKRDENVAQVQTGTLEIETKKVKEIPALLGEPDILKVLQLLPGVQGAGEGNSGLYVRGGGPDQNLVLLDNATVYNTGHLLGFFSVFNNDAIKNIKLIKGGIPAEYGGRLSSVLDIRMKEGNIKKPQISGGLGLISARLTAEGPIVKDKASFIASGRLSYLGLIVTPILRNGKNEDLQQSSIPWFYDFNAKLNWKLSDKDRLFVSGYFGRDFFNFGSQEGGISFNLPYGNATATVRWNHLFGSKLFMNTSFTFNQYDSKVNATFQDIGFRFQSAITDYGLKGALDYYPNDNHEVKIGYEYTFHEVTPGVSSFDTGTDVIESDVQKKYGHELGLYIQDQTNIGARLSLKYGIRFSMFSNTGPYERKYYDADGNIIRTDVKGAFQNYATYFGAEPRLNLKVKILESLSFKSGFNYINQYLHLVSQSTSTLPTDVWVPSSNLVKPEIGVQGTAGFFKNWLNNSLETSIEFYYKKLWNQIEFGEFVVPANNTEVEDQFSFGEGQSYGAELFIKKKYGKLNGWIGYTLSRTTRNFPDLNNGNVFPSKYDRTHDLSVVLAYQPHKKWKLNATFVYGSGATTTIALDQYQYGGSTIFVYGSRNGYRLPAYHRLDIGANYTLVDKEEKYSEINFSIYNLYNRQNPYFIFNDTNGSIASGTFTSNATQVSLFPILPTITWNFKY